MFSAYFDVEYPENLSTPQAIKNKTVRKVIKQAKVFEQIAANIVYQSFEHHSPTWKFIFASSTGRKVGRQLQKKWEMSIKTYFHLFSEALSIIEKVSLTIVLVDIYRRRVPVCDTNRSGHHRSGDNKREKTIDQQGIFSAETPSENPPSPR